MAKKKKNWDLISQQKDTETVKYRDVYEDQQLERGSIAEKTTMTGRLILAAVVSLIVFIAIWAVTSVIYMWTDKKGLDSNADPSDDYIQAGEFYYSINDAWDRISVEEYDEWYKIYHDYDSQRKPTDEPPDVPTNSLGEFVSMFSYDFENNVYVKDHTEYSPIEYQAACKRYEDEYNEAYKEYDLYYKRHTDPEYRDGDETSGKYTHGLSFYWNVNDNAFINEDSYNKIIADYKAKAEKGEISEDLMSIPLMPIDYSKIYVGDKAGYVSNEEIWRAKGLNQLTIPAGTTAEMFDDFRAFCSENNISIEKNPYFNGVPAIPDPNDTAAVNRYKFFQNFYGQLKILFPNANYTNYEDYWNELEKYCDAVHYNRETGMYSVGTTMSYIYTTYRNKYDKSEISYVEYYNLTHDYEVQYRDYSDGYWAHRRKYHPDDIDGTAKVFSMRPTVTKFLVSLIFAGIVFSLLHAVLKKNLIAQNLMSDTSDINQYHNDQHIALPEEVQRNYDWFPDAGAHSAVLVSSMISHMAISNKGLKNVDVAERAKKDIVGPNGDIECYKGSILLDDNGNPKTKSLPIIDTDYMEALFDASGAPKDKEVRKYYDPTKIPYNPGNGNRDKLQGKKKNDKGEVIKDKNGEAVSLYNTVADLINLDWEFPQYEPQRPGGAYIVDTAPVNTMV